MKRDFKKAQEKRPARCIRYQRAGPFYAPGDYLMFANISLLIFC